MDKLGFFRDAFSGKNSHFLLNHLCWYIIISFYEEIQGNGKAEKTHERFFPWDISIIILWQKAVWEWGDVLWSCSLKLSAASGFLPSMCFKCFAGLQSTCTTLLWPFYPSNILNIWPAFLPAVLLPRILLK